MFLEILLVWLIAGIIDFFIARRYEMSEKVDRGIEICYWKLSYRRKLIRTLWMLPIDALIIGWFYKEFDINIFTGIVGVVFWVIVLIEILYNYRKWKDEIEQ